MNIIPETPEDYDMIDLLWVICLCLSILISICLTVSSVGNLINKNEAVCANSYCISFEDR